MDSRMGWVLFVGIGVTMVVFNRFWVAAIIVLNEMWGLRTGEGYRQIVRGGLVFVGCGFVVAGVFGALGAF